MICWMLTVMRQPVPPQSVPPDQLWLLQAVPPTTRGTLDCLNWSGQTMYGAIVGPPLPHLVPHAKVIGIVWRTFRDPFRVNCRMPFVPPACYIAL